MSDACPLCELGFPLAYPPHELEDGNNQRFRVFCKGPGCSVCALIAQVKLWSTLLITVVVTEVELIEGGARVWVRNAYDPLPKGFVFGEALTWKKAVTPEDLGQPSEIDTTAKVALRVASIEMWGVRAVETLDPGYQGVLTLTGTGAELICPVASEECRAGLR